jgi:hypothetical protein
MKVLQTSPFPLGYRASDAQYNETAERFQHASAGFAARDLPMKTVPFQIIERLFRRSCSR